MQKLVRLIALLLVCALLQSARADDKAVSEPVSPTASIKLFNGKDLSGLTTWLKQSGHKDPKNSFRVTDGMIHVTGEGRGYIATQQAYKDYHLVVEYKWGKRTDGSKYVRNSGILLHGTGPHGGAGAWMTSIECQLAQGCEGDLIVIRGKDKEGKRIPATITSDTHVAEDGRTRWQKGGKPTVYSGKQFWWSKHQPGFKELLDTRGRDDVASPLGEWTRVDCICYKKRLSIRINGTAVNEAYDVFPAAGKILLQNEGNEIYFRKFELHPLKGT